MGVQESGIVFRNFGNYLYLIIWVIQTYALAYAYVLGRGRMPDVFFFRFCRSRPTMLIHMCDIHAGWFRYANSALIINELTGLTLFASDGSPVLGDDILIDSPLNSGLSLWSNIAVLAGMLVALRICGLVGIHFAKHRGWM